MAASVAKRSRIEILQRLASHTEAENARRLAERLRALDTEERRLQQIRGYLAEYGQATVHKRSGLPAEANSSPPSMTIGSLRSNRGFLERLRKAVDEQRGTVETQRHQVEEQTRQWRTARARTRSLEKFGERLQQQEKERSDRREQAQLDEMAGSRGTPGPKV
ncbi:MAG: flagellar export protein FliJ [Gammaproteobacteria bacterium]|nr:flagellar export protein FliJ [Gammaproteobacteria bacterium]